jgi:SAM-dependent methyltransferase
MPTPTATDVACFNCDSENLRVFYEVDNLPVHSCLLMPTAKEAIDYPRGQMRLAFCDECGFMQNSAFDPEVHEYSPRYEETQGFSPRFNKFSQEIVTEYVDRYDLKTPDKTVLEIGCGKGEFLVLMAETGGCSGIGIDPGYRPERTESEAAARIEFIQDFYSENYTHLQADMVLCRHTLEHIQPTKSFMEMVRRSIGDRPNTVIAFELPDMERVLEDQGFWDIYYEHCSYFTLGSLSRLFRACGFTVTAARKAYEGQYLLIDARQGEQLAAPAADEAADDMPALRQLVARFETDLPKKLAEWKDYFAAVKARGEKAAIWGSGSKAVAFLTSLGLTDEVAAVTDINPYRHGMFMPGTGHEIVPPKRLKEIKPDTVVAMNPIYFDEIRAELNEMGLDPDLRAV